MSEKTVYQKNVHYFPGHMKRALFEMEGYAKIADIVIEVCDARAPLSSRNPLLDKALQGKPRMLILTKSDYADPAVTEKWVSSFKERGIIALSSNLKSEKIFKRLAALSQPLAEKKREKERKIGMKPQPLRLLIVGVPNVGKSTLINNLAGRNAAKVGNKPGVTRAEQYIKLPHDFILFDTPGILPMNYGDEETASRLALIGSIKEEILPLDRLASCLLDYLRAAYPESLKERFGIEDIATRDDHEVLNAIASSRGLIVSGGEFDVDKAASLLIKEYKNGQLGPISLEKADAR